LVSALGSADRGGRVAPAAAGRSQVTGGVKGRDNQLHRARVSNAQNDSGMFELNFRDERYLPFEGAGVISRWRIELPQTFRQFSYDTISDVVLHIKYTARDGGVPLREAAIGNLRQS